MKSKSPLICWARLASALCRSLPQKRVKTSTVGEQWPVPVAEMRAVARARGRDLVRKMQWDNPNGVMVVWDYGSPVIVRHCFISVGRIP